MNEATSIAEWRIRYTACPLCESASIVPHGKAPCTKHALYKPGMPELINWMRCESCGHSFTDGYFTDAALACVFSGTNPVQVLGADLEKARFVAGRMVNRVARHVKSGKWLDVGFGNGALLFTAQEFGFQVFGLDLRRENVEALRKWGIDGHAVDITRLDTSDMYDVISMADVLEHMPFPKLGLEAAFKLINPGGVLLISMPNSESPAWKYLNDNSANPYWMEIEHYHNFSRSILYRLLSDHGFEPVEYGISERYRVCMEVIAIKRPPK